MAASEDETSSRLLQFIFQNGDLVAQEVSHVCWMPIQHEGRVLMHLKVCCSIVVSISARHAEESCCPGREALQLWPHGLLLP